MANDPFFMKNLQNQAGEIFILPPLKQNRLVGSHFLHNWSPLKNAKPYNPQAQYVDNGQIKNIPMSYQEFLKQMMPMSQGINQPKNFSKLEPAKLDELKQTPVQGVDEMIITYPEPTITENPLAWMAQLGGILSTAGSLIQTGFSLAGGINALSTPKVTGQLGVQMGGQSFQGGSFPLKHTGGKISGKDEILTILRGGETVRTEAQEKALQEEKQKAFMEAIRPYLEQKEDKPKTIAEAYDPNNKIPCLLNKTIQDEELIISIIAKAWKSNRLGFRNVLRYE